MIESLLKKPSVMFKLIYLLACTAFSASMACAAPAEKYSIIPEPEKTELKRNATRTLKLLSDKTSPCPGQDALSAHRHPAGKVPLFRRKEGPRIWTGHPPAPGPAGASHEGIPCGVITDKPRYLARHDGQTPRATSSSPIKDLKRMWTMAYYSVNKAPTPPDGRPGLAPACAGLSQTEKHLFQTGGKLRQRHSPRRNVHQAGTERPGGVLRRARH